MFEGHRFHKAIILQAVYFKLRFTLSYRDVEELLSIRGIKVDHATIQRWVFKFSPLLVKEFMETKEYSWYTLANGLNPCESFESAFAVAIVLKTLGYPQSHSAEDSEHDVLRD